MALQSRVRQLNKNIERANRGRIVKILRAMYLSVERILEYEKNSGLPPGNLAEGERVLKTRMLPFCGQMTDNFQGYVIIAYCEQNADRDTRPHEIRGVINTEGRILRMSCSCEAKSTGHCKHVYAVLFYCNSHNLNELHRVTNTEVEAMQSADFTPKPLSEYDCFKKSAASTREKSRLTKEQKKSVQQVLLNENFETVFIKQEPE